MSRDPLTSYIHDHLAGSAAAIDLVEALRDRHAGEPLSEFASGLHAEIASDRATLETLAARLGVDSSTLKEAVAWLAEKASRLKLAHQVAGELGTFEALEALALGIWGKRALWRALGSVAPSDPRLAGLDFEALVRRAEAQHADVETQRLALAQAALAAVPA